ncbi:MAG: HAD family hydrolase [Syntrophobacterales bacterium]|nr:HAD family hydrolase [Syntrophobacterales bacterium]
MKEEDRAVIFFDIGHTLAVGGEMSPRRLIGYRLGLSERDMKAVGKLIMTSSIETHEELSSLIEPFVRHLGSSTLGEIVKEIWEEQKYCVELLPGVEEIISTLSGRGYELGIISNIWHPFYEGIKEKAGTLWDHFRYVVLSYRVGVKKPEREIYRLARDQVKGGSYWMIGDTYEMDIAPAMVEGFKTVWFLIRPEREKETLARVLRRDIPPPHFAISDLRELIEDLRIF